MASAKKANPSRAKGRPMIAPANDMKRGHNSPSSKERTVPETAPTANRTAVPRAQRLASSRNTGFPVRRCAASAMTMRRGIPIPATAKTIWKAKNIAICARANSSSSIGDPGRYSTPTESLRTRRAYGNGIDRRRGLPGEDVDHTLMERLLLLHGGRGKQAHPHLFPDGEEVLLGEAGADHLPCRGADEMPFLGVAPGNDDDHVPVHANRPGGLGEGIKRLGQMRQEPFPLLRAESQHRLSGRRGPQAEDRAGGRGAAEKGVVQPGLEEARVRKVEIAGDLFGGPAFAPGCSSRRRPRDVHMAGARRLLHEGGDGGAGAPQRFGDPFRRFRPRSQ